MFRKSLTLLVVTILLWAPVASALAAQPGEVHTIHVYYGPGDVTVRSDEIIRLRFGEATGHQLLTALWIHRFSQDYELNNVSLFSTSKEANQYFGPIYDGGPNPQCPFTDTTWVSSWEYDLGPLAAGDYALHVVHRLDRQTTDLCDGDANGIPDFYRGQLLNRIITIHVVNE